MEAVKLVRNKGWSVRQTARYYGYTPGAVSKWLSKAPEDNRIEIYQKSSSKVYQGIPALKNKIEAINSAKTYFDSGL